MRQSKAGVSSDVGLGALAEAILHQAAQDLRSKKRGAHRESAREVLETALSSAGLGHRASELASA